MCEGYCVEYVVFISVHELLKCNNNIGSKSYLAQKYIKQ